MSTATDLVLVRDYLDSILVGWIGAYTNATTVSGQQAIKDAIAIRERLHRIWGTNCALRSRLARALADNDGLRDCNAMLTADLEKSERERFDLRQKVSELETRITEAMCGR
jgi:hypothetical protein